MRERTLSASRGSLFAAGEIHELKQELGLQDKGKRKEAIKKVIAAMTVGKDVSPLFPGGCSTAPSVPPCLSQRTAGCARSTQQQDRDGCVCVLGGPQPAEPARPCGCPRLFPQT